MECLTELNLQHNQLTQIPGLKSMPNLKMLNLSHNHLSSLPPDFGSMRNGGTSLQLLNLSNNRLQAIPESNCCMSCAD